MGVSFSTGEGLGARTIPKALRTQRPRPRARATFGGASRAQLRQRARRSARAAQHIAPPEPSRTTRGPARAARSSPQLHEASAVSLGANRLAEEFRFSPTRALGGTRLSQPRGRSRASRRVELRRARSPGLQLDDVALRIAHVDHLEISNPRDGGRRDLSQERSAVIDDILHGG